MAKDGMCECGCGGLTRFHNATSARLGHIKGVTRQRFIKGHQGYFRKGRVGPRPEAEKFNLTDEQVSAALADFFANGKGAASLCGRIFRSHGTAITAE